MFGLDSVQVLGGSWGLLAFVVEARFWIRRLGERGHRGPQSGDGVQAPPLSPSTRGPLAGVSSCSLAENGSQPVPGLGGRRGRSTMRHRAPDPRILRLPATRPSQLDAEERMLKDGAHKLAEKRGQS